MSRPWLSDDYKPSSKSRSRSRSPNQKKTRIDEFGRTVPIESRSRSRSRSHERRKRSAGRGRGHFSRDRNRSGSRERGRGDERFSKRRRRRSGSESSNSDSDNSKVRPVASESLKYKKARLFVANIDCGQITKGDLRKHFDKYGNVIDILVHPKNYAFIQYDKEEDARLAVEGESGSTFQGRKLDVKMAMEGKKGGGPTRGGRGRGLRNDRGEPHGPANDRDWSVPRDEPFRKDFRPKGPRAPPSRYPGEIGGRDPYYPPPGPYQSFPDPWFPPPDDPYRLDPYSDPYRDPYAPRAPVTAAPPAKIECMIFVVSPKLKAYGETIENRIKEHCIITGVSVMPEGETATRMLEDFADRDGLFAVFVNAQNEVHRSLTLNILHGTPQEHRNMPLNDAVALVGRSFEEYVDTLREKAKAATATTSSSDSSTRATTTASTLTEGFLAASSNVAYLLNLLADNQALTVPELEDVIQYLKQRRSKMMDAEERQQAFNESTPTQPANQPGSSTVPSQDEITKKILSIFSSAGGNLQGLIPSAMGGQQQHQAGQAPQAAPRPPLPPPPPPAQPQPEPPSHAQVPKAPGNSVINFDNPTVQKALDQLIQSSPVLRQNFSVSSEAANSHAPSIESISQMVGRSSMMGYGHNAAEGPGRGFHELSTGQEQHSVNRTNNKKPSEQQQHY